jgi:hypothetical protein
VNRYKVILGDIMETIYKKKFLEIKDLDEKEQIELSGWLIFLLDKSQHGYSNGEIIKKIRNLLEVV